MEQLAGWLALLCSACAWPIMAMSHHEFAVHVLIVPLAVSTAGQVTRSSLDWARPWSEAAAALTLQVASLMRDRVWQIGPSAYFWSFACRKDTSARAWEANVQLDDGRGPSCSSISQQSSQAAS